MPVFPSPTPYVSNRDRQGKGVVGVVGGIGGIGGIGNVVDHSGKSTTIEGDEDIRGTDGIRGAERAEGDKGDREWNEKAQPSPSTSSSTPSPTPTPTPTPSPTPTHTPSRFDDLMALFQGGMNSLSNDMDDIYAAHLDR